MVHLSLYKKNCCKLKRVFKSTASEPTITQASCRHRRTKAMKAVGLPDGTSASAYCDTCGSVRIASHKWIGGGIARDAIEIGLKLSRYVN